MKSACLTFAAGVALAATIWVGAEAVRGTGASPSHPAAAIVPVASLEAAEQPVLNPANACIQAFSKDICESEIEHGHLLVGTCPHTGCRTVHVQGAPWRMHLRHNAQGCGTTGPVRGRCDEVGEKDGTLEAKISYTLRLNEPCILRGFFDGRWRHQSEDGTLYGGTVQGTLGVGTHRRFACPPSDERTCERCLDVEFLAEQGLWRIGVEAIFVGSNVDDPNEELRFSLSGDFFAPGDVGGPFDLSGGWRFLGTSDGAHVVYCP